MLLRWRRDRQYGHSIINAVTGSLSINRTPRSGAERDERSCIEHGEDSVLIQIARIAWIGRLIACRQQDAKVVSIDVALVTGPLTGRAASWYDAGQQLTNRKVIEPLFLIVLCPGE